MIGVIHYGQAYPVPGKELSLAEPEMFRTAMSRAFNFSPVPGQQWELVLTNDHLERLEGMACTWLGASANPYDSLVRAIKRYGSVRVWMEHPEAESIQNENDGLNAEIDGLKNALKRKG